MQNYGSTPKASASLAEFDVFVQQTVILLHFEHFRLFCIHTCSTDPFESICVFVLQQTHFCKLRCIFNISGSFIKKLNVKRTALRLKSSLPTRLAAWRRFFSSCLAACTLDLSWCSVQNREIFCQLRPSLANSSCFFRRLSYNGPHRNATTLERKPYWTIKPFLAF